MKAVNKGTPFILKEQKPLRILFVTARYLPHIGGTEIHTYEVAQRLTLAGYSVTVLTTDLDGKLPAFEQAEEASIIRVPAWPRNHDYYVAPAIYRIIREGQWDLVHCQGYHTFVAPLAMLAAWRSHLPFVVTFHSGGHSSRVRNVLRPLQRAVLRPLLARAERLVAVSIFEANFFQKRLHLPREKFVVIPNGAYPPQVTDWSLTPEPGPVIVSIGRLERYKGHHRIIAALPLIRKQFPDVRLRIIGTGPYKEALQRLAHNVGMAEQVDIRVIAATDREGMASVLRNATLVILLSDYESQGIAVLEALVSGRPVLVTDTSALHTLAEDGLVYATRLGSTTYEVAAAVVHQLKEPLVPTKIDLPTWEACVTALLEVYTSVRYQQT